MNDELTQEVELATPPPEPDPPALALPTDPVPTAAPEPTAPPVEVVSVDELLDRLTQGDAQQDAEEEASAAAPLDDVPLVPDPDPIGEVLQQLVTKAAEMIIDLGQIEEHTRAIEEDTGKMREHLETIAQTLDHPMLTTSFADYTVTEGLLLLLLLSAFLAACARMLRGGLSWLRS